MPRNKSSSGSEVFPQVSTWTQLLIDSWTGLRLRSGLVDSAQASLTPLRPRWLRSGLVAGWAESKPATLSPLFLSTYLVTGRRPLGSTYP